MTQLLLHCQSKDEQKLEQDMRPMHTQTIINAMRFLNQNISDGFWYNTVLFIVQIYLIKQLEW